MIIQNRILAVDDNPTNLAILETLLEDDYCFKTAASGEESLHVAPDFRPDVVLLDIMMPGIDGYETCRRLRKSPNLRHAKIIMVSAKAMLTERLEGYAVGADDYVTKPFDHDELLAKIRVYSRLKSVEEVDQVKGRLIEVLQHSTRAPLAAMICNAEMLVEGVALDHGQRLDVYRSLLQSAWRLARLLEKGETLAAMKSHTFTFEFESNDVCDLVRKTVADLHDKMADRNITCSLELPHQLSAVYDEPQMEFVVRALLDNAIRFSPEDGTVDVAVTSLDGHISVCVTDRGPGITTDLLPRLFEKFANPDSPLHNQGDGLSLAIVREIMAAHNGNVRAENNPDTGASLTVQFPSYVPHPQEQFVCRAD